MTQNGVREEFRERYTVHAHNNLLLSTRRIDEHFGREQATKLASKKVLYLSLISHIGGRLRSMFGLSGALLQRLLVTT